ncbi:hypothetical protein RCL1_003453 [Eukaryota sp. TZLM3-RCL]
MKETPTSEPRRKLIRLYFQSVVTFSDGTMVTDYNKSLECTITPQSTTPTPAYTLAHNLLAKWKTLHPEHIHFELNNNNDIILELQQHETGENFIIPNDNVWKDFITRFSQSALEQNRSFRFTTFIAVKPREPTPAQSYPLPVNFPNRLQPLLKMGPEPVYHRTSANALDYLPLKKQCLELSNNEFLTNITSEQWNTLNAVDLVTKSQPTIAGEVLKDWIPNESTFNRVSYFQHYAFDPVYQDNRQTHYFLGLMYTDGNVFLRASDREARIGLRIHVNQKYLIEKFLEFIKARNVDIKYRNNLVIVTLYSQQMARDLLSWGICRNKTKMGCIHAKLVLSGDFWRGCFDGDGCFQTNRLQLTGWYQLTSIWSWVAATILGKDPKDVNCIARVTPMKRLGRWFTVYHCSKKEIELLVNFLNYREEGIVALPYKKEFALSFLSYDVPAEIRHSQCLKIPKLRVYKCKYNVV